MDRHRASVSELVGRVAHQYVISRSSFGRRAQYTSTRHLVPTVSSLISEWDEASSM